MNSLALLVVCVQACLVQNVFSQCLNRRAVIPSYGFESGLAPLGYAEHRYAAGLAGGIGVDAYGGVGEGNVAIAGELPVAGSTAVTGQVPIMGAVKFAGPVCAAGSVSIAGKSACGCGCGY